MERKTNNTIIIIIVCIILMVVSFICGFFLRGLERDKCLYETFEESNKNESINQNTTDIDVKDQFTISTYGGVLKYYIISNGKVYYKIEKDNFVGINVCPTNGYCEHNTTFNNNVTEIKEIENAKRIKSVIDIKASDESFIYFVITDNKVYKLYETMDMSMNYTGVKVEEINELSNKNIVDLIDIKDKKYIFKTLENEQIEY